MSTPAFSQLGGLPVPVDIAPGDQFVLIRNGIPYRVEMKAISDEVGAARVDRNLSDLLDKVLAQANLAAASPYDDWRWAGTGVNPPGPSSPAVLTQIATDSWAWVYTNNTVKAFPDQQIPHDYKEGTDIFPHIHFASLASEVITGEWTMAFNGSLSAANGEPQEPQLVSVLPFNMAAVAGQTISMDFPDVIPGLNRKISSTASLTLKLTLSAGTGLFLKGFDGHYQKDGFGSVTATSKA